MMQKKWANWAAAVAATCILSGCGGNDDSSTVATASGSQMTAGKDVAAPVNGQNSTTASVPADEFEGKEMVGFMDDGFNGAANSYLKLLIASIGPQSLITHLELVQSNTEHAGNQLAAQKFIELIRKAYSSQEPLRTEVKDLLQHLLTLPEFAYLAPARDGLTVDFQEAFFKLFDLPDLSHAAVDILGFDQEKQAAGFVKLPFPLIMPLELDESKASGHEIGLQQALNGIQRAYDHLAAEISLQEPLFSTLGVKLATVVPDVQDFKTLIIEPDQSARKLVFKTDDRVTLPVFDEKTQKRMLLTLQPSAVVVRHNASYRTWIKNSLGEWKAHDNAEVTSLSGAEMQGTVGTITLSVIAVAPAE